MLSISVHIFLRSLLLNKIYQGDNLEILGTFEDGCIDFIYIDPPFNTGKVQVLKRMKKGVQNEQGFSYIDQYGVQYLDFIEEGLVEACRVLKKNGSILFHIDQRELN